METDIDRLPARLRDLDELGYRDFAAVFGPRLRRYFLKLGSCPADAESLAVSCLTDIALKVEHFLKAEHAQDRGPSSFANWVFAVARNAWVDERRRSLGALTWDVASPNEIEDDAPTAANEPAEREAAVAAAISQLSEIDRAIVTARYFEGEPSFAEIGRRLGLSESAARVRHHRALQKLSQTQSLAAYAPDSRAAAVSQEVCDD
jgi:RNA polymerase sigma factor (sigma-70 family)